jgi:murein DD-endopeptidase MepM/ murein hydrolase activator NlpD
VVCLLAGQAVGGASAGELSEANLSDVVGQTALVSADGDGVNLRAGPAYDAEALTTLADGTTVSLRIDATDTVYDPDGVTRWWPVAAGGQEGWITGAYLTAAGTDGGVPAVDTTDALVIAAETGATELSENDLTGAGVRVISPDGVNIRAEPHGAGEIVTTLPGGAAVSLRIDAVDTVYDAAGTRWWPVSADGVEGWIAGFYLGAGAGNTATAEASAAPVSPFGPGSYVAANTPNGQGLLIRAEAAPAAPILGDMPDGTVLPVMDGPFAGEATVNGWFLVTYGDVTGYIDGDLLVTAAPPAPDPAPSPLLADASVTVLTPAVSQPATSGPTGTFTYPVVGRLTQSYGCSPFAFEPFDAAIGCNFHNGIDLAAAAYTPLVASDGGIVTASGFCDCGLGFYVAIDHGNGFETLYGHMAEQPPVTVGQRVNQGEVIGPLGSTGASTGPHVHFMIRLNGTTVDPLSYLG